jgi:hypothetical protein
LTRAIWREITDSASDHDVARDAWAPDIDDETGGRRSCGQIEIDSIVATIECVGPDWVRPAGYRWKSLLL